MFVAGALSIIGFRALVWLPHYVVSRDSVFVVGYVVIGMGLPLGVAMLVGSLRAIWIAEMYLLLGVVGMCAVLVVSACHILPPEAPHASWRSAPDLLVSLCLLALLLWTRFPRHEPNA